MNSTREPNNTAMPAIMGICLFPCRSVTYAMGIVAATKPPDCTIVWSGVLQKEKKRRTKAIISQELRADTWSYPRDSRRKGITGMIIE
jgi:hypothetical protein